MTTLSNYFTINERQREGSVEHFGEGFIGSRSMTKNEFDAVRRALHNAGINFLISEPESLTPRDASAWFIGVRETQLTPNMEVEVQLGRAGGHVRT